MEMPKVLRIKEVVEENESIKTFTFKHRLDYMPGQFIMLWLPRFDEKPYSLSLHSEDSFALTIEKKGEYSKAIFDLKPGDKLGIRGPYGQGFEINQGKTCVIGGGCGIAPLIPLIPGLKDPEVIVGCQTAKRLLFRDKIKDFKVCTDDGTEGYKGFVTNRFKELMDDFDMVYTCGPEPMMKAVFDICQENKIPCQASLERFMICGIGVCGQCMCDNLRLCKDGPVLGTEQLAKLQDFGKSAMIKTGKKVPLKEYYQYRTEYK